MVGALSETQLLEVQLQAQLQIASAAGPSDVAERGVTERCVRIVECWSVGHPKRFSADLEIEAFREIEDLEQ